MTRKCTKCKVHKELNSENYVKDKNRKCGFSYRCKPCDHAYGKQKYLVNPRKGRWKLYTAEVKKKRIEVNKLYLRTTLVGRSLNLIHKYKIYDKNKGYEFDLTKEFFIKILQGSCVYCGESRLEKLGCDRLDNSKGHTMANCVSCCDECNTARSDHFTFEEMKIIGEAIRIVKTNRK